MNQKDPNEPRKSQEEFINTMLEQWNATLDDLQSQATTARSESEKQIGYLKELDILRAKVQQAHARKDELKASSKDWENLSKDVDEALEKLKLDFERAASIVR